MFLCIAVFLKLSILILCVIEFLVKVASLNLEFQLIVTETADLSLLLLPLLLQLRNLIGLRVKRINISL